MTADDHSRCVCNSLSLSGLPPTPPSETKIQVIKIKIIMYALFLVTFYTLAPQSSDQLFSFYKIWRMYLSISQSINQIYIAPISQAKQGSVAACKKL